MGRDAIGEPASKEEWVDRAKDVIATLRTLGPEDLFDEQSCRYHSVCSELGVLAYCFGKDPVAYRQFLDQWPQRAGWLPDSPDGLRSMNAVEVHFRLQKNIADERWVDGALVEPFRSGTLVAAIERLIAEIDNLDLRRG